MKTVLLVEDSEDDRFFMKMACQRSGIPHVFRSVTDGQMAIDYLSGADIFADRGTYPIPDVIFLDISMPKKSGHDVLAWVRSQHRFGNLPVIMLTGSVEVSDINRACELHATSYLQKNPSPAEFGQTVRLALKYWLEINIVARNPELVLIDD